MICASELEYLPTATPMQCTFCRREVVSNGWCRDQHHFVCDDCHRADGITVIRQECLHTTETDPLAIALKIMRHPSIPMHGPEHHPMVAAVIIAAVKNQTHAVGDAEIEEAIRRGSQVPGGVCGLWGSCGAGIGVGIATSILEKTTPLSGVEWHNTGLVTSKVLSLIAERGGPRCCKRNVTTALQCAAEILGLKRPAVGGVNPGHIHAADLEDFVGRVRGRGSDGVRCDHCASNKQCLGRRCVYHPVNNM
eukprot:GAFH01003458.1.p1 GENE.GAFH01003458.1~~GAFH01003458.1.p1  ORF type:complete len:272 (+),score=81.29 GAFH01003458.1:67-816(+)